MLARPEKVIIFIAILAVLATAFSFFIAYTDFFTKDQVVAPFIKSDASFQNKMEDSPKIIKAIYITANSAASPKYMNYLDELLKTTEINAAVIDVKDFSGLRTSLLERIYNLVQDLHKKNIYTIARVSVFQDMDFARARPELALQKNNGQEGLWRDNNGLFWLDPSSKEVLDYTVSVAKDAFSRSFDEVNFDYIRFPSDGDLSSVKYPLYEGKKIKAEVIGEAFAYLRGNLPNKKISVDLFGLATVSRDDLGVGQIIEGAFMNFDYVCPMLYPSHFKEGFLTFENPAEHPYEVVKYSLENAKNRQDFLAELGSAGKDAEEAKAKAKEKLGKLRPWLQDFDFGANYGPAEVQLEIKATQDALGADYNGFMIWNSSGIYSGF